MQHNDIVNNVSEFLKQYVGDRDINPDEEIFVSGLVNSLFAMQLVMYLEKEFELKVGQDDLDLSNFKSLNAIANFVLAKNSLHIRMTPAHRFA